MATETKPDVKLMNFARWLCAACLAHRLNMTPREAYSTYLEGWEPTEQWIGLAEYLHDKMYDALPDETVQ